MAFTWGSSLRIFLFLILLAAIIVACYALPVEKILKNFLSWVEENLGPWGPLVLAIAYIPLTVLAVPASILTVGGGYLYGLPVGFVSDSVGATLGAGTAFLLGRTIGKPFVVSKLKDYPQFQSVALAIENSGFKICLLLRLAPLVPFNMLNYLLSVTPIPLGQYLLSSWIGMMPITLALVYVGTTLKDLSDVTHGWSEFSLRRWVFLVSSLIISVILIIGVSKVAKDALRKALTEQEEETAMSPEPLTITADAADVSQPLLVRIDSPSPSQVHQDNNDH